MAPSIVVWALVAREVKRTPSLEHEGATEEGAWLRVPLSQYHCQKGLNRSPSLSGRAAAKGSGSPAWRAVR